MCVSSMLLRNQRTTLPHRTNTSLDPATARLGSRKVSTPVWHIFVQTLYGSNLLSAAHAADKGSMVDERSHLCRVAGCVVCVCVCIADAALNVHLGCILQLLFHCNVCHCMVATIRSMITGCWLVIESNDVLSIIMYVDMRSPLQLRCV